MNITKAKLMKGTFLAVSYRDAKAVVDKSFPDSEAPPKMQKAFQSMNHHLADLTEQYDSTGQPDYDNIAVRSYAIIEHEESNEIILTGLRTLKSGKTILLNSPKISLDVMQSNYPNCKSLIECLENCRVLIVQYMNNNKSAEESQMKIFGTAPENVILKSKDKNQEPQTAVDIIFKDVIDNIAANTEILTEQEKLDLEVPLTVKQLKAAAKKRTLTPAEQAILDNDGKVASDSLPTLNELKDQAKAEGLSLGEFTEKKDKSRMDELKDISATRTLTPEEQQELMKLNSDKNLAKKRSHHKKK